MLLQSLLVELILTSLWPLPCSSFKPLPKQCLWQHYSSLWSCSHSPQAC